MYIKNGKIKIANCISEIPLSDLQIADHLVLFEKTTESGRRFFEKEKDALTSMILCEITAGRIYSFECSQTFSNYEINSNLNEKTNEFEDEYISKGLENSTFERLYFLNKDNTLMFLVESAYRFDLEEHNVDNYDERMIGIQREIFEKLFPEDGHEKVFSDVVCSKDNKEIVQYFPIKLDDNNYLVFATYNDIDVGKRRWNVEQKVHIFNKSGVFYTLPVEYEEFVKEIKKLHCYKYSMWDWLNDIDYVANYEIENFLNETFEQRNNSLSKVYSQLRGIFSWDIETLFSPIWENKELDLKIYPDGIKQYDLHCNGNIVYRGEYMNVNDIEDEGLQQLLKREIRVANMTTEYKYRNNSSGVSPFDGYLYDNGVLQEKEMQRRNHYIDDEIVAMNYPGYGGKKQYFVKINGYYLPANEYNPDDKKMINDYNDRLEVMKELSISAKMMGEM